MVVCQGVSNSTERDYLTTREVAVRLNVGREGVRWLVKTEQLQPEKAAQRGRDSLSGLRAGRSGTPRGAAGGGSSGTRTEAAGAAAACPTGSNGDRTRVEESEGSG